MHAHYKVSSSVVHQWPLYHESDSSFTSPSLPLTICVLSRTCPTRTGIGMKVVSTAPGVGTLWWTSPLPPRRSSCCALTVIPTSTHPSARNARKPSCQVRTHTFFRCTWHGRSPSGAEPVLGYRVGVWPPGYRELAIDTGDDTSVLAPELF